MPFDFKREMLRLARSGAMGAFDSYLRSKRPKTAKPVSQDVGIGKRPSYDFDEILLAWRDFGGPTSEQDMTHFLQSLHLSKGEIDHVIKGVTSTRSPLVNVIFDIVQRYSLHEYVANILVHDFKLTPSQDLVDAAPLDKQEIVHALIYLLSNDEEVVNKIRSSAQTTESVIYKISRIDEGKHTSKTLLRVLIEDTIESGQVSLAEYYFCSAHMILNDMSWDDIGVVPLLRSSHVDFIKADSYNTYKVIEQLVRTTRGRKVDVSGSSRKT